MPHIVVLGAGVVGLSTAILALDAGYQVTIVARDLPADQKTTSYTSPWAGAHHVSAVPGLDSEPNKLQHGKFLAFSSFSEPLAPMQARGSVKQMRTKNRLLTNSYLAQSSTRGHGTTSRSSLSKTPALQS